MKNWKTKMIKKRRESVACRVLNFFSLSHDSSLIMDVSVAHLSGGVLVCLLFSFLGCRVKSCNLISLMVEAFPRDCSRFASVLSLKVASFPFITFNRFDPSEITNCEPKKRNSRKEHSLRADYGGTTMSINLHALAMSLDSTHTPEQI
jgi:hypothetical protein